VEINSLLVLDRFDIAADGSRLGFEDIPSLLGMQVRNKLDERKYHPAP
jgi:serine/threonine-protein kinase HipA